MSPEENLRQQLELAKQILRGQIQFDYEASCQRLARLVCELNQSLTVGDRLPESWTATSRRSA